MPEPWNPSPRTLAFLAAIRVRPSVTVASAAAKVSRESHYRRLERSPEYRAAFETAYRQGIDALEDQAIRRAHDGVQRLVLYHGEVVMVPRDPSKPRSKKVPLMEYEYSDSLMLGLLRAKKPDEYKERVQQEVTVKYDIAARLAKGRERAAKREVPL